MYLYCESVIMALPHPGCSLCISVSELHASSNPLHLSAKLKHILEKCKTSFVLVEATRRLCSMGVSGAKCSIISSLCTKSYVGTKLDFCNATCFSTAGASEVKPGYFSFYTKMEKVKVLNMQKPALLPGLFWKAGL